MTLRERIAHFAQTEHLWQSGDGMLVAVSGGPDSVVLLDVLCQFAGSMHLAVGHVNHLLRVEAAEDAVFVKELADRYDVPFLLRTMDVPARVAETGESVEEAARVLRYAALQEMAQEAGMALIATGHTADDQAETVLMRVLRGTGVTGLAGIPPRRENIVRPLLCCRREEIMAYLRERGLAYRTDLTNYSTEYTRNRVRLELLPRLEAEYAPRLRERLAQLADLARADEVALAEWTDTEYARFCQSLPDGVALPVVVGLPLGVQRRLWRRALAEVRGSLDEIGYDHLQDIAALAPGQQVHLPGARVLHEAGRLVFLPAIMPGEEAPCIHEAPLPVPGTLCLPEVDCCLTVEEHLGALPVAGGDVAVCDAGAIQGALRVRSWLPGDRYRPLGAPGKRKIQDIFVDEKLPRRLRMHVPVVVDEAGIIWLAGFRVADRVKMLPTTSRSLRITVQWELNPWTLKPSVAEP